jgi:hypothetical protein
MSLSPAAAAKIAGVSRSLISRAIKCGDLKATLRNNGHQSIDRADLDDWMSRRTERASHPEPINKDPIPGDLVTRHTDDVARIAELEANLAQVRERLAKMEGEAAANAARITDLANDRDAWRAQAERLADASHARPAGLLARIFGR